MMFGDGSAKGLERLLRAVVGGRTLLRFEGRGLVKGDACGAQRLVHPQGECRLELRALRPVHGLGLLCGQVGRLGL